MEAPLEKDHAAKLAMADKSGIMIFTFDLITTINFIRKGSVSLESSCE